MSEEPKEGKSPEKSVGKEEPVNPFTRKNRDLNGDRPKKKKMLERRDPVEARISFWRQWNQIKMRTMPVLKSMLCFDFFARVVIFCGLTYFLGYNMQGINSERVTLQQDA